MHYELLAETLSISDGLLGYQVSGTIYGARQAGSLLASPYPASPLLNRSSHLTPR